MKQHDVFPLLSLFLDLQCIMFLAQEHLPQEQGMLGLKSLHYKCLRNLMFW